MIYRYWAIQAVIEHIEKTKKESDPSRAKEIETLRSAIEIMTHYERQWNEVFLQPLLVKLGIMGEQEAGKLFRDRALTDFGSIMALVYLIPNPIIERLEEMGNFKKTTPLHLMFNLIRLGIKDPAKAIEQKLLGDTKQYKPTMTSYTDFPRDSQMVQAVKDVVNACKFNPNIKQTWSVPVSKKAKANQERKRKERATS